MSTDDQQAVGATNETEDALESAKDSLANGNVEEAVSNLIREVEDTREELQEVRDDAEFAMQTAFDLEDIVFGDGPDSYDSVGATFVVEEHGGVIEQLDELRERREPSSNQQTTGFVDADILDAHRWLLDLRNNNCADRKSSQERVARLFRKFTRRASDTDDDSGPKVDASGQTYSLTSTTAIEILDDENALEDVKQESKPTVIARVLRDLQRATLDVDCQCSGVDECKHALFNFQAGRPHKVKVSKQDFEDYLQDAVQEFTSKSSRSESGTGEETREDARSEMEQLENAEVRQ